MSVHRSIPGSLYGSLPVLLLSLSLTAAARSQPAQPPVAAATPDCPVITRDARNFKNYTMQQIHISYNPSAPGAALKDLQSLTLHIVAIYNTASKNKVQDLAMTRSEDGLWTASYDPPDPFLGGYYMFWFEDGQHHTDRNAGRYWDIMACYLGKPSDVQGKAQTYLGSEIVPGIRRTPDLPAAIALLKEDVRLNPTHAGNLFFLWFDELLLGNHSPAAYEQMGRELDEVIAQYGTNPTVFLQISGIVSSEAPNLPPASIARYREAAAALPEKGIPARYNPLTDSFDPIPRTHRWVKGETATVHDYILAPLDYSLLQADSGPQSRTAKLLAFAKEYPGSREAATAYIAAFRSTIATNDTANAEQIFAAWSAWDPKNPDPLATMAKYYVDRKIKTERAIELLNQALALYKALDPQPTRRSSDSTVKAQIFSTIAPFSASNGKIESLRGQAYLQMHRPAEALSDLRVAADAMPERPDVQYALGEALEQTGDRKAALEACLTAASAPYDSPRQAGESYERLFVQQKLGTRKAAEDRLLARIAENDKKLSAQYTPVALDRATAPFHFQELSGAPFDNAAAKGKPTILDFWTIWCGACVFELPAFEQFQRQHPEVNLVTVAIDPKPSEVSAFLAKKKLTSLHVAVTADLPLGLTSAAYPTTIVLDAAGRTQFIHDGVLPNVPGILERDLNALKSPAEAPASTAAGIN